MPPGQHSVQYSLGPQAREDAGFQVKRLAYALSEFKRNALLSKLETYNAQLKGILDAKDRLSKLERGHTDWITSVVPRPLQRFCSHADRIFRLLHEAWQCQCRKKHRAILW